MSADLLAEFDSFYQSPTPVQDQTFERSQTQYQNQVVTKLGDIAFQKEHGDPFGDYGAWEGPDSAPIVSARWGLGQNIISARQDGAGDDWGDFETGQGSKQQEINVVTSHDQGLEWGSRGSAKHTNTYNEPQPVSQANSIYSLYPLPNTVRQDLPQREKVQRKPSQMPRDENVLFDAEEDQEDDDFGDFEEAVENATAPKENIYLSPVVRSVQPTPSLLDFDSGFGETANSSRTLGSSKARPTLQAGLASFEVWTQNTGHSQNIPQTFSEPQISKSTGPDMFEATPWDSFRESASSSTFGGAQQQFQHHGSIATNTLHNQSQSNVNHDAWDDFDMNSSNDFGQEKTIGKQSTDAPRNFTTNSHADHGETAKIESAARASLKLTQTAPHISTPSSAPTSAPPDNIPPPAMLIALFTPILTLARTQLYEPIGSQATSTTTREAILAHPETQTFLVSYLAIVGILARIVAGRKLRWKRDTLLAQSMRIGPASSSGKSGGMKLAGVDKGENAKEEREVADILKLWRAQLGRLRSTVAGAGTGIVPELSENPIVRTAKESDGAITAPRACALCALKRNERISNVDSEVQDSFGEWWVDHWGHRACKSFWDMQKENLNAR